MDIRKNIPFFLQTCAPLLTISLFLCYSPIISSDVRFHRTAGEAISVVQYRLNEISEFILKNGKVQKVAHSGFGVACYSCYCGFWYSFCHSFCLRGCGRLCGRCWRCWSAAEALALWLKLRLLRPLLSLLGWRRVFGSLAATVATALAASVATARTISCYNCCYYWCYSCCYNFWHGFCISFCCCGWGRLCGRCCRYWAAAEALALWLQLRLQLRLRLWLRLGL